MFGPKQCLVLIMTGCGLFALSILDSESCYLLGYVLGPASESLGIVKRCGVCSGPYFLKRSRAL